MQGTLHFGQAEDLHAIRDRLTVRFGGIRIDERPDPVSQFVGSFLASRTYDRVSSSAFRRLVTHFPTWDAIADAPETDIRAKLWDVTFPEKKAGELRGALRNIRACAGTIDLDFLADWEVEQALCWLERIQGVGRKISAATLNFSVLRGRAFVVDTHVLRILRRFGFVGENATSESAYDAVMVAADAFDADGLFELHWLLKGLGQKTCTHARAFCVSCPLADICLRRVEEGAIEAAAASMDAA